MCCVFQPAFGCCAYPKAGWNTSFWPFGPFLFISNVLQWFFGWNQEKLFRNVWKKQCFKLGGWHETSVNSWYSPKNVWNEQTKVENGPKNYLNQLWVRTAAKSWSKYTTFMTVIFCFTLLACNCVSKKV